MVLEEIATTSGLYNIQAKTKDGSRMDKYNCFISMSSSDISLNGKAIELIHKNQQIEISRLLSLGTPHVCYFDSVFDDGSFTFNIHCFAGERLDWGNVTVTANKNDLEGLTKDINNIQFKIMGEDYFIILSSYKKDKSTENESMENFAFSIIDDKKFIDVERLNIDDKLWYQAKRKPRISRNAQPQSNYFLVKGKLEFKDHQEFISDYQKNQLETIMQKGGSYLDAWRKYTAERGNILLNNVRKLGKIYFTCGEDKTVSSDSTGIVLYLDKEQPELKSLENQIISIYSTQDEDPIFIRDLNCSWNDYLIKKKEETEAKFNARKQARENGDTIEDEVFIEAEVEKVGNKSVILKNIKIKTTNYETDNLGLFPIKGFFVLSTLGDEMQIQRQNDAWDGIANGSCGIQHLGALLEADANILQTQHQRGKVKLSSNVYEKVFTRTDKDGTKKPCPPTENQMEAIDCALRTPDIALIQGPPGTGKTTVITAILEQLNVMQDKHENSAGKVLATSYQHDAVINMTDRLRINSLPTYKFGAKHGQEKYTEHIEDWTKDLISRIRDKNPSLRIDNESVSISSALLDYKLAPTKEAAKELLNIICRVGAIDTSLLKMANDLYLEVTEDESENQMDANRLSLLKAIRALRVTDESFDDDGKQRANELYSILELDDYFDKHVDSKKLLRKASTFNGENTEKEAMLKELKILKNDLLDIFSFKPAYTMNKINPQIIFIAEKALDCIHKSFSNTDKKSQIISNWVSLLENNPWGLEGAIKDCDFIYAASAQQSVSRDIIKQKISLGSNYRVYDTVVIDEAARAAPPDLLIPMCLASKRIILVGDHRQLPQLVDEDVCKAVENRNISQEEQNGGEKANTISDIVDKKKDPLHLSLFETLFVRLKELEKKDGIKRTVTLNKQFRTHPVLGDFASKEFYEKYPGEGYSSDWDSTSRFAHDLPGIKNKAAVWIDVPLAKGKEEKPNTSYCRPAEVSVIVNKLKEWATSEAGSKFSYGIITFYKEQEKELKREIGRLNLPVKCRIGSVDAFQGMEFDVVFLSVVRSNNLKIDNPYGFLCSVNRLCVSMSRQKRVLVCVGDKNFCTTENARKEGHIPALANFYDLCANSEWGALL